jgi:hypothetical protein
LWQWSVFLVPGHDRLVIHQVLALLVSALTTPQAPTWMFSHYLHAQRLHLWDPRGGAPQAIVAHAVFATSTAAKVVVLKMYRWWQWDLLPSARLASGRGALGATSQLVLVARATWFSRTACQGRCTNGRLQTHWPSRIVHTGFLMCCELTLTCNCYLFRFVWWQPPD